MRMELDRGRVVMIAAIAVVLACNSKKERIDYSNSPDSGAVAPAMRIDTSMRSGMPDSSSAGPVRTGKPGAAGDTLSTRGRPVGTGVRPADTARKRP